jgi:hypothetical protein
VNMLLYCDCEFNVKSVIFTYVFIQKETWVKFYIFQYKLFFYFHIHWFVVDRSVVAIKNNWNTLKGELN